MIAVLLAFMALLELSATQLTNPTDVPGFTNLQNCVQFAFTCGCEDGVMANIGCENWECVCSDFTAAIVTLSSQASILCSSNTQDVAAAASVLNDLCAQITVTPTIAGPTTGPSPTQVANAPANTGPSSGTTSSPTPSSGSGGLSGGAITGIVVPLAALFVAICAWIFPVPRNFIIHIFQRNPGPTRANTREAPEVHEVCMNQYITKLFKADSYF